MKNKKAYFNYEIFDIYEAGIKLNGKEVKAIREGAYSFNDSYCILQDGGVLLKNFHISVGEGDPLSMRTLLLNRKEINELETAVKDKKMTIVPTELYFTKTQLIKMKIGTARGKKKYDKRETIKERDAKREIKQFV